MRLIELLEKSVKENDIVSARAAILSRINANRNLKDNELLQGCQHAREAFGGSFFEKDDGETKFTNDKPGWNKALWDVMRVEFENNFSEKKIKNIVKIMEYLRKENDPDFQIKERGAISVSSRENADRGAAAAKKSQVENDQELKRLSGQTPSSSGPLGNAGRNQNSKKRIVAGVAVSIASAIIGKCFQMTIPGAIVGVAIGVGIVYMKNNWDE